MLRVTTLGGAAAWPNPGQGCSSYLVQSDSTRILLDCGPNTLLELRKHINWTEIDAIVISHCHSDHILDLVPYRYGLVYSSSRRESMLPVWLPPGGEVVLDGIAAALAGGGERFEDFWRSVFRLENYDPDGSVQVGDLRLTFHRTQHFIRCFAIKVEASSGATVLYGADTGAIDPLIDFARDCDLLIAEGTSETNEGVAESERGHITPEDAGRWASESHARSLLMTHLWCERSDSEVIARVRQHYDGPLEVARPGLTIDVD